VSGGPLSVASVGVVHEITTPRSICYLNGNCLCCHSGLNSTIFPYRAGLLSGRRREFRGRCKYPFRPLARVGLEVDAPVSVVLDGVLGDP
jgi:hypothetical protein